TAIAGFNYNQPVIVLDRWQKPGDIVEVQKFISKAGTPAFVAVGSTLFNSNGIYSDASTIRLKNLSISYDIPNNLLRKIHLKSSKIYVEGQNILTITDYKGADPESQSFYVIPTLH